eukprot:TRINITY_DN3002_c0_g1_i2.p1 TRINITY_DN3002_c0_g1~~TRINITY_DN3002_c0_g1_i2.p1  ORF type:complete len:167 (-),score=28.36 TRINITY_DN3002_c0_g1_i2:190-690(-)
MSSNNISKSAKITGDVRIGQGCIIGENVVLDAANGPIIIHNDNIFQEYASVINLSEHEMIIGSSNLFESYSNFKSNVSGETSLQIGDSNIFEAKSNCVGSSIGSGCVIGSCVTLEGQQVNDNLQLIAKDSLVEIVIKPRNAEINKRALMELNQLLLANQRTLAPLG